MFSTLSMDYKGAENPGKADSPYDASRSDDQSGGHGGTRRPGNLWTAEAREDMFRRREAGETWETICLDYPKRSRHAMQQQYSMMKKQKAIANGTWTTNRRGRKRRNPGPERWPASAQRKTRWDIDQDDELSESDGFDDVDSEGMDGSEESGAPTQYRDESMNGRPSALIRSATEPTKSTKPRIVSFPIPTQSQASLPPPPPATMLPVTTNGFKAVNQAPPSQQPAPNGHYEQDPSFSTLSRKRRRMSQEPGSSLPVANSINVIPAQIPNFVPASVMLDRDDILEILRRGEERANQSNMALDTERTTQRQTFDSAIARANRRACDAQDRVSFMSYEHGDAMKSARMEFAETLKSKTKEHVDAMAKVTRDLEEQGRIQTKNIESLARQNDELQREVELLRSNRPGREVELEQEVTKLKSQLRASTDGLKQGTAKATTELLSIYGASGTQNAKHLTPPRQVGDPADTAQAGVQALQHLGRATRPLRELVNGGVSREFDELFLMIAKLNDKVDDLSHKQIVKDMREIVEQKNATERNIKDFNAALSDLSISIGVGPSSAAPSIPNGISRPSTEGGPVNGDASPASHVVEDVPGPDAMEIEKPEEPAKCSPESLVAPATDAAAPVAADAAVVEKKVTASPPPVAAAAPAAVSTSAKASASPPSTAIKPEMNGASNYPFLGPPRAPIAVGEGSGGES